MLELFKKKKLNMDQIAEILKTSPEMLKEFETMYQSISDEKHKESDNFFDVNSRDMAESKRVYEVSGDPEELTDRITDEIIALYNSPSLPDGAFEPVTKEEINLLPPENRPQLTGTMIKKDIDTVAYPILIDTYQKWLKTGDIKAYHIFRQGLDVLDLDIVTYNIIDQNPNSMGHWFPALRQAAEMQDFFKVPETKIVKVPLPILQLTRLDYNSLTPATLRIVDKWCTEVFELDEYKTYFIKTGTYSSKFDFRNAKVTTPKEVREIGQYLLFIHHQALSMAHYDLSDRRQPVIYGVSTTTEWVVREYIEDTENNPCIYHGMPLHTEYRVFIDCDRQKVLGIHQYWDAETMKKRFSDGSRDGDVDMKHDYIVYSMHEETLYKRYEENKEKVLDAIKEMLPHLNLRGQWSLDVMQNGDDFWLIDMATADTSALSEYISGIEKQKENWLPDFSKETFEDNINLMLKDLMKTDIFKKANIMVLFNKKEEEIEITSEANRRKIYNKKVLSYETKIKDGLNILDVWLDF